MGRSWRSLPGLSAYCKEKTRRLLNRSTWAEMVRIICYLTLCLTWDLELWPGTIQHPVLVWHFFFLEGFPQNLTCTLNGCAGNLPDLSRRGDGGVEPSQTVSSAAAFYSQPSFPSWEKIYCGPPRHGIWSRSWDLEGRTLARLCRVGGPLFVNPKPRLWYAVWSWACHPQTYCLPETPDHLDPQGAGRMSLDFKTLWWILHGLVWGSLDRIFPRWPVVCERICLLKGAVGDGEHM